MLKKRYNFRPIWLRPGRGCTLLAMCVYFMAFTPVWAQQDLQPRQLVEAPTAGLLPSRGLGLDLRFYGSDGILGGVSVGLFSRGMVGVSFGGSDLLGNEEIKLNPRIEFSGRLRVIEEGYTIPALAVGYTSQGYGMFDDELKRYTRKSKGVYVVASKNFKLPLGHTGLHVGANRSFEDGDGDSDFTGYVGVDTGLGKYVVAVAEYDFGLNDNSDNSLGSGKGFLNAGIRWTLSEAFALEFDLKNIFRNGMQNPHPDRELRIAYFGKF